MTELQRILTSLTTPGVLATVVNVEGSAYRRPGARMFVSQTGETVGTISGGCLEADVVERSWELTVGNQPHLIRYDSRVQDDADAADDDWGFGMGCNGAVDVLLERIDPDRLPDYVQFLRAAAAAHRPAVMGTVFASASASSGMRIGDRIFAGDSSNTRDCAFSLGANEVLATGISAVREVDGVRVFFEFIAPPPVFLICGAGHDVIPLSRLASMTGWSVYIADRREVLATADRFPQADGVYAVPPAETLTVLPHPPDAAVVMTHRYPEDVKLLAMLVESPAKYIGVLGPQKRTDRLLRSAGLDSSVFGERLHAPVGLDLGAETPEEIALAILAEATAALHGRAGGRLRDSGGPIHGDSAGARVNRVRAAV